MKNDITINNLLYIYEKELSKSIKNKIKLIKFDMNKMENIVSIKNMLLKGNVGHNKYNIFLIYEPKCRLVMSLNVSDKIINHFVTRYVLEKKLTKYLDDRNVATRKNMGTDYGIKLVVKYLNELKKKKKFYILKIDISKYFYSIDHIVLKELLKDKLDNYEYMLISKIIDSTNKEYINNTINKIKHDKDIPFYQYNKGLPIGNMTSQFLSIFYLYKLDHYIVHNLHIKYYVRYMDDFILMDCDLDKLKKVKEIIEDILYKEYKLNVNKKKTMITNCKEGFSFLGYTYKIVNNKTIIKIRRSNIDKIKRKVIHVKRLYDKHKISYYKAFCVIMTYQNIYKYSKSNRVLNIINRYWYND